MHGDAGFLFCRPKAAPSIAELLRLRHPKKRFRQDASVLANEMYVLQ
jgi:hypothetical protein